MNTPSPQTNGRAAPPQQDVIELAEYREVQEPGSTLLDYWFALKRHRWLIVACVAAVVLCGVLYTFTRTPIYTAQATLLIEPKPPQVLKIQDALSQSLERAEYYKTQYEILKSRALAARVIREEGLEREALFAGGSNKNGKPGLVASLRSMLKQQTANRIQTPKQAAPAAAVDGGLIDAYLGMVSIKPTPGTGLVRLSFSAPDPALSSRLANAHALAYVRYGLDLRSETNEEAVAFLEKKLLELKERVENSEAALNSYRRDKGIISLDDKENIVVHRLSELNKLLTQAEVERLNLEAQVRTIRSGRYDTLPMIVHNPAIQSLKGEISRLEGEQAQLAKEFRTHYPPLEKISAQLEAARRRLVTEIDTQVKTVETAYQAAATREIELRATMEEQKTATLNLKDSAVQYAILAREVDTNKQLYDGVLQRIKEMGVAGEIRSSNIYVMEKAELPRRPSYPNKRKSLMLALAMGLVLGVGLAFLRERLDNTFRTPEELERYIGLPQLGMVPDFARLNGKAYGYGSNRMLEATKDNGSRITAKSGSTEIIVSHHPFSVMSEAYRALRSAILLSRAGEPPRTILLTSAAKGEGKTTTVVNTAITFSQMGIRVLIIDADLRRPRCHDILGLENEAGLTEVLAGQLELERAIEPATVKGLSLLPSGACPPNPGELLGSKKMLDTINSLRDRYEYIFIDSSPLLAVSDGVLLSTMVDGVLFVVDGQQTPRQAVKQARSLLANPRIKMLGVLLNRVDTRDGGFAYHYSHYYHYYHEGQDGKDA